MTQTNRRRQSLQRLRLGCKLLLLLFFSAATLGGCDCGGETTVLQFECENDNGCKKTELCQNGKCEFNDNDKDGWAPNRGSGPSDCDDSRRDVFPGAPELCGNKRDDNCDGEIDEKDCICEEGDTRECGSDEGACVKGTQQCLGGQWDKCENTIAPSRELCNKKDDDCDGEIDEDFTQLGDTCDLGLGVCLVKGKFICSRDGTSISCDAKPKKGTKEVCDDLDNDCDGQTDELKECERVRLVRSTISTGTIVSKSADFYHLGVLCQMGLSNSSQPTMTDGKHTLRGGFLSQPSIRSKP